MCQERQCGGKKIDTTLQLADPLTKPLPCPRFEQLRWLLMGWWSTLCFFARFILSLHNMLSLSASWFSFAFLYSFVVAVHEGALTPVRSQWSKNKTLHCNLHSQSPRSHAIKVDITGTRECHAQQPLTIGYGWFPDVIFLSRIHPWTTTWLYSWFW